MANDSARMRDIAVRTFFNAAFRDGMYPPENMERVFGVQMDDGVGSVVFNAWKTLHNQDLVTEANVKEAIAHGRLPEFFEATVRSLTLDPTDGGAPHSYYTIRLLGEDVGMPDHWTLPPGELFGSIAWDRRVLAAMADTAATGERVAPAAARRPEGLEPRRLFDDATPDAAVGRRVAEGLVLQAEGANGTSIAVGQPIEVVEGNALAPGEEQMLRQHLERFVGRELIIRHLTSERGRQLNGRRARVVGRDTAPGRYRLHVSVDGGQPFRVLSTNLAFPNATTRTPATATDDAPAVLRALHAVLAHYPPGGDYSMRSDMKARVEYLRTHVEAGRVPPPTRCGDAIQRSNHSGWVQTIKHLRPCCKGDNVCDLRRFDLNDEASLKEWVITGTCEACQAVLFGEGMDDD